jgi:hypothetical protein
MTEAASGPEDGAEPLPAGDAGDTGDGEGFRSVDGAAPGGDPTGLEVTCRTHARVTEYVYAGLIGLFVLAGLVLLLLSIGRSVGPAVFGVLFLALSAFNGRTLLVVTASELSFNSRTGIVRWRSTFRRGALDVASIRAVRRDRRPGVFALECGDGSRVEFWLTRRRPDADEFFRVIGWANPSMATDELYQRSGVWWKGLTRQE